MSVLDFSARFPDEKACKEYIEQVRWGGEPACPRCGDMKVYRIKGGMGFKCGGCKRSFSVRSGLPMEESRLPLRKWLLAIYYLTTARKGISSIQLAKEVGCTQKTAWFLEHRIRAACSGGGSPLSGEIEADESYFGGKEKNKHAKQRKHAGRGAVGKAPVMAAAPAWRPDPSVPCPRHDPRDAARCHRRSRRTGLHHLHRRGRCLHRHGEVQSRHRAA